MHSHVNMRVDTHFEYCNAEFELNLSNIQVQIIGSKNAYVQVNSTQSYF
jgi:hypothetical protein